MIDENSVSIDFLPNFSVEPSAIAEVQEVLGKLRKEHPGALIEAICTEYHFGTCPCGGNQNKYFNIGKDHWFYCDICRVKWNVGRNIFSSWKNENEKIWEEKKEQYANYKVIEPAGWNAVTEEITEPTV